MSEKIGFIGQGWIGKNYADHFQDRGFEVVRYSLEEPYIKNKESIKDCSLVFIAVPTPTTPQGFDISYVKSALDSVGKGNIAIIKSTIKPGTVRDLTIEFPDLKIIHSPEFLRESFARYDVDHPERLIVGLPELNKEYKVIAEKIIKLSPKAPYTRIVRAEEAEFMKYVHNTMGYVTVVFSNLLYDIAVNLQIDWKAVKEFILNNEWFPENYIDPIHKSGRGAGGHCFIKDFAALKEVYSEMFPNDVLGNKLLEANINKNNQLLKESGKDLDILRGVYGT